MSVAFDIEVPIDHDERCAITIRNASLDKDGTFTPNTIVFKYTALGITLISYTIQHFNE